MEMQLMTINVARNTCEGLHQSFESTRGWSAEHGRFAKSVSNHHLSTQQ